MLVSKSVVLLFLASCLSLSHCISPQQASDVWRSRGGFGRQPEKTCTEWQEHDAHLYNFLKENIPEALAHTGAAAFDDHLKGVQSVLRSWGAEETTATAGLFHSIYGTEGFQGYKLPFNKRAEIRNLIGAKAERLVWMFCVVDRFTVDMTVDEALGITEEQSTVENSKYRPLPGQPFDNSVRSSFSLSTNSGGKVFRARDELGRFLIPLQNEEEWLDFLELTLADWLEQVEGASEKANALYGWGPGEAFAYRRLAYHKMARILAQRRPPRLQRAVQMCDEVYARERVSAGLPLLLQTRTPPMNDAAKEARAAIASVDL